MSYAASMTSLLLALTFMLQAAGGDEFSALRQQWARNLHDKKVDASVAEYGEDADFIDPGGNRVHGQAAIRRLFQTITSTFDSDLVFTSQHTEVSGDLAYDSGMFRETLITQGTGQRQESTGSYLTVYRRGKDGSWLIVQQMWAGPPLEQTSK